MKTLKVPRKRKRRHKKGVQQIIYAMTFWLFLIIWLLVTLVFESNNYILTFLMLAAQKRSFLLVQLLLFELMVLISYFTS